MLLNVYGDCSLILRKIAYRSHVNQIHQIEERIQALQGPYD